MTAAITGTQAADAALEGLRHELQLLPAEVRDEAGRLLAKHLRSLIPQVRAFHLPAQRARS